MKRHCKTEGDNHGGGGGGGGGGINNNGVDKKVDFTL
jgi:hypothetical protein